MPQMMPFNWMMMFILFLFIFISYMIIVYYIYLPNLKKVNKNIIKFNFNWKW